MAMKVAGRLFSDPLQNQSLNIVQAIILKHVTKYRLDKVQV